MPEYWDFTVHAFHTECDRFKYYYSRYFIGSCLILSQHTVGQFCQYQGSSSPRFQTGICPSWRCCQTLKLGSSACKACAEPQSLTRRPVVWLGIRGATKFKPHSQNLSKCTDKDGAQALHSEGFKFHLCHQKAFWVAGLGELSLWAMESCC